MNGVEKLTTRNEIYLADKKTPLQVRTLNYRNVKQSEILQKIIDKLTGSWLRTLKTTENLHESSETLRQNPSI